MKRARSEDVAACPCTILWRPIPRDRLGVMAVDQKGPAPGNQPTGGNSRRGRRPYLFLIRVIWVICGHTFAFFRFPPPLRGGGLEGTIDYQGFARLTPGYGPWLLRSRNREPTFTEPGPPSLLKTGGMNPPARQDRGCKPLHRRSPRKLAFGPAPGDTERIRLEPGYLTHRRCLCFAAA